MRGSVSSSKRKSSKNRKSSSKKKKSKGKELKKRTRYDSVSSFDSVNSDSSSSDYRRKVKKSKRRQRRDYSISSCSDDDHTGSDSLPRCKDKKTRRTKADSKSSDKLARKRYRTPEHDGDERRVRKTKRKRSSGDRDERRKKKSSTKKSKRDLSPDSLSCSTCPSKSSSSTVSGKQINMETENARDNDREVSSPYMPPPVNSSSRLRSAINVAYQPDEDDRWDGNLPDDGISHELDDYPSPISLDNKEVGDKRELDNHSHHVISDTRIQLEDVAAEEETKLGKSEIHVGSCTKNFEEKETNVSVPSAAAAAALEGDNNIELILRQKALENLRKFKAEQLQTAPRCITNVKTNNENDVPNQSTKQVTTGQTKLTNMKSGLTFEKDSSRSEVKKHLKPEVLVNEEPVAVEQNHIISVTASDHNNQGTPVAQSSVLEPTSSARPISGQHTSVEERDKVNDGPKFEQKTMSVMRGGEMVQVTYKVKIPKRAPALARRQLRR